MTATLTAISGLGPKEGAAFLLEAEGRGFWAAEAGVIEKLRDAFADLEDRIEGVA
jgi:cobalamin biosynthesis Mg chelatase CobN